MTLILLSEPEYGVHSQFPLHSRLRVTAHPSVIVQRADPRLALYVPAKHCKHVPPSAPVYPASQIHAVMAVLPAGEFEFAGQLTQAAYEFRY